MSRFHEIPGFRSIAFRIDQFLTENERVKYRNTLGFDLRLDEKGNLPITKWRIRDFKFIYRLGYGEFFRVYLCHMKHPVQSLLPRYYSCKVIPKSETLRLRLLDCVTNEKKSLEECRDCLFITHLYRTFQDTRNLYIISEFVQGNELFYHLRYFGRFMIDQARALASEIVVALEHLHERDIIYRNLKPESVMVDREGHIKLVNLFFSKTVQNNERTHSLKGTPDYLAPEIIEQKGHSKPADLWSLGVFLFEMLVGYPPFYSGGNVMDTYRRILTCTVVFPSPIQDDAMDLIRKLLVADPEKRLCLEGVKNHRWFRDYIDWDKVRNKELPPVFQIHVSSERDCRYFRSRFARARMAVPNQFQHTRISRDEDLLFKDF